MGYFDEAYLRQCRVAVLRKQGMPVAYTNMIPSFTPGWASVDHIRLLPAVSPVAMHFLLMNTIEQAAEEGATSFNLGLAPLSKLEQQVDKNLNERLLSVIKRFGGRYYSFAGLEQFKSKFLPNWSPRYIVYQPGGILVRVAAALAKVTVYNSPQSKPDYWRWYLLALAILAGACYASFPLAAWLNPAYAWHGLVSVLGRDGQPYASLFNGLDILSSCLVLLICLVITRRYTLTVRQHWLVGLLAASSVGALVAALVSLPPTFDETSFNWQTMLQALDWRVVAHGAASFLNSAAFVMAVVVWAWPGAYGRKSWWRWLLAAVIVCLATIGAVIGEVWPAVSPYIQRLFIASFAFWLVVAVIDIVSYAARRLQFRNKI